MEIKKTLKWIIKPNSTPLYIRKCSRCKKVMPYYCSEKFRVNFHKKTIDIWLIYKCKKCDNTSNIDILTRVDPQSIDRKNFIKFECNDVETAWKYAFDQEIINKNKIKTDFSKMEYDFTGDILTLEEISNLKEEFIEFEVYSKYHLDLKLSNIIRKNLNVSRNELDKLISLEIISVFPLVPLKKCKIKNKIKIILNVIKLRNYLKTINSKSKIANDTQ